MNKQTELLSAEALLRELIAGQARTEERLEAFRGQLETTQAHAGEARDIAHKLSTILDEQNLVERFADHKAALRAEVAGILRKPGEQRDRASRAALWAARAITRYWSAGDRPTSDEGWIRCQETAAQPRTPATARMAPGSRRTDSTRSPVW